MPRLRSVDPPPAPANGRARMAALERRRIAREAIRKLERTGWVSDGIGYGSKPSARDKARRLIDSLVEFEGVPRERLTYACRIQGRGWQWWVGLQAEAA